MGTTDKEAIFRLEERRIDAINRADGEALRGLLTHDYTHVHATGRVDDRDTYIDTVLAHPRVSERGDFTIRHFGDAAVLIGDQINSVGDDRTAIVVSQVAVRQDDEWRFASVHVGRKS